MTPAQKSPVLAILHNILPPGAKILAFGSRTGGRTKPCFDLALAIDVDRRLSLSETAEMAAAFSESAPPWKGDIVDRHALTPGFAQLIEAERVPFER